MIPDVFSATLNGGIDLFPRYFLYRYYFVKDGEIKDLMPENYVFVKHVDTGEHILYSPTQVEISDDVAAKMLKKT